MSLIDLIRSWFRPSRPPAPVPPISPPPGSEPAKVVVEVNRVRKARGLPPLSAHADLTRAAVRHASDMQAHRLLSHTGSDGSGHQDRIIAAGYSPAACGECIAHGQPTAVAVVADWEADPPHCAILLGSYKHIGVSRVGGYWCADFGLPT